MAIMEVLRFPDERLRTVAKPVTEFDDSLQQLIDDMLDTMYEEKGIGLAATQVDRHVQVIVMDHSEDKSKPMVFINPSLSNQQGSFSNEEGCLSVPGIYAKVDRHETVTITAQDRNGDTFTQDADELLSICIQHEMDHLAGKLFVDYLSPLKRQRIRQKLEKQARLDAKHA
ncbi:MULTISPECIES: peptide deformylase [Ferrimonas]|uniref:peptide deformylase n=1 Tax=Ferrimonas TaxID=44011 RepID=UPI0004268BBA|nr:MULTISPECIES: peptide deformylase [Ferrimonas]USD37593.1 peptide deformylase [Ferrimonas sp. SCSIO 43195]